MGKITFDPDGNGLVDFYVLEQTMLGGVTYFLVTDVEDGDGDAYILKDTSASQDTDGIYEFVTEDQELTAVGQIFESLLEDVNLQ